MIVWLVYIDSEWIGNIQAIVDTDDKVLDYWSLDDAHWNEEYFTKFMSKVGVKVFRVYQENPDYDRLCSIVERHVNGG